MPRKLIYYRKLNLNSVMVTLSWVSISQYQKVTPTLVIGVWVNYKTPTTAKHLACKSNCKRAWNSRICLFFSFHFNFLLIFFNGHSYQELIYHSFIFITFFFLNFFLTLLFPQWGPQAIPHANSIVVSPMESKLFLGKIFWLGIDHKVMNKELMLQNIPKTEDKKPICTDMSFNCTIISCRWKKACC